VEIGTKVTGGRTNKRKGSEIKARRRVQRKVTKVEAQGKSS
jgi:hypothetical protein